MNILTKKEKEQLKDNPVIKNIAAAMGLYTAFKLNRKDAISFLLEKYIRSIVQIKAESYKEILAILKNEVKNELDKD